MPAKLQPQRLASHTPPSRRNPAGLARCQRWRMRNGLFWQCRKPARTPMPVCSRHGAGFASREAKGERQNPALTPALTGSNAPKATAILVEQHPEFGELFAHHSGQPIHELLDFRPQLAASKALVDAYLQKSTLEGGYGPFGSDPTILRALGAIDKGMSAAERFLSIEAKMGPVTHAEMVQLKYAYSATLAEYVPREMLNEARLYCRRKFEETRQLPGGCED